MRIFGLSRNMLVSSLAVVAAMTTLILFPKPVLVTYNIANSVSTSIYWPSFGESGLLFDSEASFVKIDEETSHLHVCQQYGEDNHCQQFSIIETKGLFAVIQHWFSNP